MTYRLKVQFFNAFALLLIVTACRNQPGQAITANEAPVLISGAMHQVMMKGQLQASISLDTIRHKENLYGLGPMAYLAGEITVVDGRAYRSTVVNDSVMVVEESYDVEAPFFVYANVPNWSVIGLPDNITTLTQFEEYLDIFAAEKTSPFAFKLRGTALSAHIHVVNLPAGTPVNSPADAHRGQVNYTIQDEEVEIIGFYSRNHKGIFTHHDSHTHMHLITKDRKKMGHLDALVLKDKASLFLPQNSVASCTGDLIDANCRFMVAQACY